MKSWLLIAALLTSASALAAERVVVADNVNLRSGPGADQSVQGRLPQGIRVQELGQEGEWVKVDATKPAGTRGWLLGSALNKVAAGDAEVVADKVNLRAAPSTDYEVMVQLTKGTPVKALFKKDDWVQVETVAPVGGSGWIHGSMLSSATFAEFKKHFDYRNARAKELTGYTFFEKVRELPDGAVEVTASDVWLKQPEEGRKDNLQFILWMLSEAHPAEAKGRPLKVVIVDAKGKARMELAGKAGDGPKKAEEEKAG